MSAGSTPDETGSGFRIPGSGFGVPGSGFLVPGSGFARATGDAPGAAFVISGAPAGGSFEYLSNVKSNTFWAPSALNFTFACIEAGTAAAPVFSSWEGAVGGGGGGNSRAPPPPP